MKENSQNEPPSQTFANIVCTIGTPEADCGFCGRKHFAGGPRTCLDKVELLRLRVAATEHPEKYHENPDDSIMVGEIDRRLFVYGCPCNSIRRLEDFIFQNRELILRYLGCRAAQLMGEAAALSNAVAKAEPEKRYLSK